MAEAIIGLGRLQAKLKRCAAAVATPLERELDLAADDLVRSMRRIAPVDKGALKASIRKTPGASVMERKVVAGGPLTTKAIRKGVHPDHVRAGLEAVRAGAAAGKGVYDYANGVEFGHRMPDGTHVAPDPFFFPTVRVKRRGFKRRMSKVINRALDGAMAS